jgi:2-polyprenyl-6-methoxyphenol hydroxylase-like FAD-dependent oxidoreductase
MKAIVCGAGIAGLTVAGELGRGGWDVTVLESAAARREQGYMLDFFGPGFDASREMGVLPRLRELSYPVDTVSFIAESGRVRHLDYTVIQGGMTGDLLSLMRPDIELALSECLPPSVSVQYGKTLDTVEHDADTVTVVMTDGSTRTADVLVGADGIHSKTRAELFGPEQQFIRQLGFHTWAFIFEDPDLYEKLGSTWGLTDTINRTAGLYRLRNHKIAMFGAHRVRDAALPADRRSAVIETYSGLGWFVPDALTHVPDDSQLYYDQVAQIELPLWSSGRVVLVGDACQAVSLLAGQGASLAVAGGRLLAQELLTAESVDAAFRRYQEQWKPVVTDKQAAGRRSARSFLPSSRSALFMRRAGLRLLQLPGVRRLVTSRIVGKRGVQPVQRAAAARPAVRPEKRHPPRNVPSSER